MVTTPSQPVEFFLTPGSVADVTGLKWFDFQLPPSAEVYANKAYSDYRVEDTLAALGVKLLPIRNKNSKRPLPPRVACWQSVPRKIVETAGSLINRRIPKNIHAVTVVGFELKVALFVLGRSLLFVLR